VISPQELRGVIRNAFCPTGPGGGIDSTCSPKGKRGAGQPLSLFADAAAAHPNSEVRERAGAAVEHIAGRLTPTAAARVVENVQKVEFHETVFAVEAAVRRHALVAEFSRLLHGSDVPMADVERKFPKCLAYWRSKKLWP
jgi:hypothetical protein